MGEIFLSYNSNNEAFIRELYRRLTRDGVNCFLDKESIAWGANWVISLEEGINRCDTIVMVLTPDFIKSEWTKLERTSSMADDPAGEKRNFLPLLLKPCGDLIPRFLKPIQQIDVASPANFEAAYSNICTALGGTVVKEFSKKEKEKLPPVSELPANHRMPYRSLGNGFVGRVEPLWEIHEILREGAGNTAVVEGVGVLMGTGGLGKTQLAIEYVHRFGLNYPGGVFWIDAEQGISTMIAHITQCTGISIDGKLALDEQLIGLWREVSKHPPVLIVLDNFPEDGTIRTWLPPEKSIYTLVTTRRRDLDYARLSLNFMTEEEGMVFLNKGERNFGDEAKALVKALGGLPLALELSCNFLNLRAELTIDGLLEELNKVGEMDALRIFADKYTEELPTGHVKEVAATFNLSFELATPAARSLMECLSLCAPAPLPKSLEADARPART